MNVNTALRTNGGDWLKKFGATWTGQIDELKRAYGAAITEVKMPGDALTDVPIVYVTHDRIYEVLRFVKTNERFEYDFLADLTATDEFPADLRFEVIYNLYSLNHHWRMRLKVRLHEGELIPTVSKLWPGAGWAEREVFDMYGIIFSEHADLRRILNDERFDGHPLRKDYPINKYQIFNDVPPARTELLEEEE